jgi:hypothetical protein
MLRCAHSAWSLGNMAWRSALMTVPLHRNAKGWVWDGVSGCLTYLSFSSFFCPLMSARRPDYNMATNMIYPGARLSLKVKEVLQYWPLGLDQMRRRPPMTVTACPKMYIRSLGASATSSSPVLSLAWNDRSLSLFSCLVDRSHQ